MAYAALAGLQLQYGLYSAFLGVFIYCLMGTSKDITMGPTAIMSILTYSRNGTNVTMAILLTFMCGVTHIAMSIFRLGFLVRYISHPVITGFMSAASIVISTTQLKKIFGISTPRGFFQTIIGILTNLYKTKVWDLVMGVTCMLILFLLKWMKERWATVKVAHEERVVIKVLRSTMWFIGTGRNAVIVLLSATIAYLITDIKLPIDVRPLTLTRNISGGLPPFALPSFTYDVPGTNQTVSFSEMMQRLGSGLAVVPLMAFLESIAIAKAFGKKNHYKVDASQELLTIGVANFFSSFVSSYPITGSFGRSAVNAQSNVMTPLGGIFTGAVVLLSLQFLSDAFQYIPASALAAVIIMAVINLFDPRGMRNVWKINKYLFLNMKLQLISEIDVLPMVVTFLLCFYDIAYGIMAGIGVSILILLAKHAMPAAKILEEDGNFIVMEIKQGLDFPGAEYIEETLQQQAENGNNGNCKTLILDCSNLTTLDYSATEAFKHGSQALKESNISFRICGLQECNENMLKRMDVVKYGAKFYDDVNEAKDTIEPRTEEA
uniref:STAS domain-containing protein n=1 Tax=Ciona savignyi TaxID=51511 RepID=H2Z9G2_CIOSA